MTLACPAPWAWPWYPWLGAVWPQGGAYRPLLVIDAPYCTGLDRDVVLRYAALAPEAVNVLLACARALSHGQLKAPERRALVQDILAVLAQLDLDTNPP